ncbi:MAG: tyrosine-type recombinase/integrase [Bradyrhizobiaceae bacterium]|nr:tyrosine-type recombinase/integrase [Bradyrhizobiaceae bacterium]
MKISFYLDKPASKTSVVLLNVAFRGKRFRFGTGISLNPKDWNKDRQEPRASDPYRNAHTKQMAAIVNEVRRAYNELGFDSSDGLLTSELISTFKDRIRSFVSPDTVVSGSSGLISDFQVFIDTYTLRSSGGMVTSKRPGKSSINSYRQTRDSLLEWSRTRRRPIEYENITLDFYADYCQWLAESRGLVDASISNYIKVIKTFMKWATEKGYHDTTAYQRFYRDKRNVEAVALTVSELRTLRDLDLADSPRLARVRDHFLLQAFTGLRYGDLQRLQPQHFDGDGKVIRITTTKTDTDCIIPVTRPLALLLEKYPSRLFEFSSSVKQNQYLKELGQRAGFDKAEHVNVYRLGKRVESAKPRYDLLTTHVARRTFVTTSVRFGVPESVISAVTGHSPRGMLQQHYIRLDEEAICEIITTAWEKF